MTGALPDKGDPQTIYVIDISSYVFRAYHALPPLSSSKGEPTHAVAGVASMLLKLLREREPHTVIVAMDSKERSFRKELFEAYKANRPPMPDELRSQVQPILDAVRFMGLPLLQIEGVEADDVIGTLAREAARLGMETVILGPGDIDQAHQPNEFIEIAQVEACEAFLGRLVDVLAE